MDRVWAALWAVIAFAAVYAPEVFAVPPGVVSGTAQAVCDFRAVAAQHPDPKLRNPDYLAAKLCSPVVLPYQYEAARDVVGVDPEAYSGYFYVNARTRYIDELLSRAAAGGAIQVVILGAGFDSRAYRFSKIYPEIRFFEVDLPATIGAKELAVKRLFGASPGHVRYVPIDFDSQSLESELPRAGYDSTKKTFFILEGVTMYVTMKGNDATFAFIGAHSAAGSIVVFDYVLRRVVEGDYTGLYSASSTAKGVARIGEPYLTGWTPREASDFAQRHRLSVRGNLGAQELTRRYLIGSDGRPDGRIPNWYGIIEAMVP